MRPQYHQNLHHPGLCWHPWGNYLCQDGSNISMILLLSVIHTNYNLKRKVHAAEFEQIDVHTIDTVNKLTFTKRNMLSTGNNLTITERHVLSTVNKLTITERHVLSTVNKLTFTERRIIVYSQQIDVHRYMYAIKSKSIVKRSAMKAFFNRF